MLMKTFTAPAWKAERFTLYLGFVLSLAKYSASTIWEVLHTD